MTLHCVSKIPTFKLSVAFPKVQPIFTIFCTAGKRMKFATKCIRHYPPRHVVTLPWEIKNSYFLQIFSRCGRKCKQIAFYRLFVIQPQMWIFSVFKIARFHPILIANKSFHVTVLLCVYFCDQFMALEIRHSGRYCSVCQQSTWYSATRTRFW